MTKISFNLDPEQEGMIEDLKQDFFNKTSVDLTTTKLLVKLIYDAWNILNEEDKYTTE